MVTVIGQKDEGDEQDTSDELSDGNCDWSK